MRRLPHPPAASRQPPAAMLTATALACSRGERRLFDSLAFALHGGDWLHVKGANGSGKTTLLRTLIGLSPADAGSVRWGSADIRDDRAGFRRACLYQGHATALKDDLTAPENLRLALAIDGIAAAADASVDALDQVGLADQQWLPVRYLSAGQKRRVLLARLLLRPADLWVLDEPLNALDADASALLARLLRTHLDAGGMAVVTSHQPLALDVGQELTL